MFVQGELSQQDFLFAVISAIDAVTLDLSTEKWKGNLYFLTTDQYAVGNKQGYWDPLSVPNKVELISSGIDALVAEALAKDPKALFLPLTERPQGALSRIQGLAVVLNCSLPDGSNYRVYGRR